MSKRPDADETAVRYLLGDMTEEEKEALETGVFQSEEAFEQVGVVEDELIDDYLSGNLSAEERQRFEKAYLASPERRERLEFARTLRKRLSERPIASPVAIFPARSSQSTRFFLAAAVVLLAALGAYFAMDSLRMRRELGRLEAQKRAAQSREMELSRQITEARGRGESLERQLARERAEKERLTQEIANLQALSGKTISFALIAGLVREGGTLPTLKIPPGTAQVRFTAPLPDPSYVSYRAAIQTPEGKEVWKGNAPRPDPPGRMLGLTVPAGQLPSGDYILSVTGITASGQFQPAADYSFRVKRH